ncbi:hypothetical protein AgCh_036398 [Apium graveolens]
MWRSIFTAQEVVKQGCRRKIGTGSDTNVWKIPWLPSKENGFVTTEMPGELENITVYNLMQENDKKWDEEILSDLFNNRDVQLIKQIPISIIERQDSWMWLHDEKGDFTVKSCYRNLVGEYDTTDAGFWRKVWALKIPKKITFFLWRVCKLCLPTAKALIEKRVAIDGRCAWCHLAMEDAMHIFFECSFARLVWEDLGFTGWLQVIQGGSILATFKHLFSTGTMEQCILVVVVCWSLWNRRNKWVWSKVEMSVFGTKSAAVNLLADWRRAQQDKLKATQVMGSNSKVWQKPQVGWVKINMDAALFTSSNSIGVGGVIRDADGGFVSAMCKPVAGIWMPREAEAISLKEVLSWTKQQRYTRCVFETDSKILADAYNGRRGNSYFHTIVNDCLELSKHFENVLVQFVHRSANGVAHLLARASHSESGLREWSCVAPDFLMDVITFDSI